MSDRVRMGIVGCGKIASAIAHKSAYADKITFSGASSRRVESAQRLAQQHQIENVFQDWQEMIASAEIDAVYVATPTSAKEEIAIAAASNGKHILIEKPFNDSASLARIISAAASAGVAFMDATHFTHHPRTQEIKNNASAHIGEPRALRSSFYTPLMRRENIRFDPAREPTGALGDLGWYCMRAVVEYLRPQGEIKVIDGGLVRDAQTGAVIAGAGVIVFDDGKTSTIDFGYNAGALLMDLDIYGESGVFKLDDFVQDWAGGLVFEKLNYASGYFQRKGVQAPPDFEYISSDSAKPQSARMLDNFADISQSPTSQQAQVHIELSRKTQELVDKFWNATSIRDAK